MDLKASRQCALKPQIRIARQPYANSIFLWKVRKNFKCENQDMISNSEYQFPSNLSHFVVVIFFRNLRKQKKKNQTYFASTFCLCSFPYRFSYSINVRENDGIQSCLMILQYEYSKVCSIFFLFFAILLLMFDCIILF